jgi:putative YphP/YqiW family bacilliredoxin
VAEAGFSACAACVSLRAVFRVCYGAAHSFLFRLLRDGKLVFILERTQIENRDAQQIAAILTDAYEQFCQPIATP